MSVIYKHGEHELVLTDSSDYFAQWEIIRIAGRDVKTGEGIYMKDGELVPLAEAEVLVKGRIKWDGCSNWDMHPEDCSVHFCEAQDVSDLASAMRKCYEITKNICKDWDGGDV